MKEGDIVEIGDARATVIETPGHTRGHVSYYFPDDKLVFVGDTLFSIGCGKLLEGDAKTMWHSLVKLMLLPPETNLYCGHEYTANNARFALTIEPENAALQARAKEVAQRTERPAIASHINRTGTGDQSVLARLEPRDPEAARHGRPRALGDFRRDPETQGRF